MGDQITAFANYIIANFVTFLLLLCFMPDPPEDIKQVLGQKDQSWLTLDDAYTIDNN